MKRSDLNPAEQQKEVCTSCREVALQGMLTPQAQSIFQHTIAVEDPHSPFKLPASAIARLQQRISL